MSWTIAKAEAQLAMAMEILRGTSEGRVAIEVAAHDLLMRHGKNFQSASTIEQAEFLGSSLAEFYTGKKLKPDSEWHATKAVLLKDPVAAQILGNVDKNLPGLASMFQSLELLAQGIATHGKTISRGMESPAERAQRAMARVYVPPTPAPAVALPAAPAPESNDPTIAFARKADTRDGKKEMPPMNLNWPAETAPQAEQLAYYNALQAGLRWTEASVFWGRRQNKILT